jgi:hypothetical protein
VAASAADDIRPSTVYHVEINYQDMVEAGRREAAGPRPAVRCKSNTELSLDVEQCFMR